MSNTAGDRPRRTIVVAYARNRMIGRDNWMPWQLPSDLKHFKSATMGKPMILGRKTFQSIGKPLPGRTMIVVTRDPGFQADGIQVVSSIRQALDVADAVANRDGVRDVIIAGGGQIYAEALPFTDRIIATEVALEPEGDTQFPELDPAHWIVSSRVAGERGPRDDAAFEIVTYDRLSAAGD